MRNRKPKYSKKLRKWACWVYREHQIYHSNYLPEILSRHLDHLLIFLLLCGCVFRKVICHIVMFFFHFFRSFFFHVESVQWQQCCSSLKHKKYVTDVCNFGPYVFPEKAINKNNTNTKVSSRRGSIKDWSDMLKSFFVINKSCKLTTLIMGPAVRTLTCVIKGCNKPPFVWHVIQRSILFFILISWLIWTMMDRSYAF